MPDQDSFKAPHRAVRTTWNETKLLVRGRLTDKKIEQYEAAGWYSEEVRQARRERNAKRLARLEKREGNFLVGEGGKLIFSPR